MKASYSDFSDKSIDDSDFLVSFSERLAEERERAGFSSPKNLLEATGLQRSTYYAYEKGTSLPGAVTLALFSKFGLNVQYLLTGERSESISAGDTLRIPVMSARPSAGAGSVADDEGDMVRGVLEVSLAWARRNLGGNMSSYRVLTAKGDSMADTIHDGDPLLVDTSVRSFQGEGIYVLQFSGALLTKRIAVDLTTQRVKIISDNKLYPQTTLSAGDLDGLQICGRVTNWLRMMRG